MFHRRIGRSFLLVLFVAIMVFAPLGGTFSSAQPEGGNSLAQDDGTGEETPASPTEVPPEPQVTEVPPTEAPVDVLATEPLATEAPVVEPQTLTITVYRCDHPEFDTGFSENLQLVLTTCTGSGNGTFTVVTGPGESVQSGSSITVPIVGDLSLQEQVPAGYDNPIANCSLLDANGNVVDQIGPGETSGGAWKVGSIGTGDVHCDWYQVDRGVGNVYVVNMACPAAMGMQPPPTMDDLVAQCTKPAGSRQFFVEHGAGLERMNVTGGEFNDALFEAIQTGPIAIRLDDPSGFEKARVFCQGTTLDGAPVSSFAEVSVSNFRASGLNLANGQRIHCSWFNILEGPGLVQTDDLPPLTTAEPAGEPATLIVVLHTCPAGYDPTGQAADPATDCTIGPDGVSYTLSDGDPATTDRVAMTGQSATGEASFENVPAGEITVSATTPPGIGSSFVLGCGGGGIDPVPVFLTGGATSFNLPAGVIMTCRWFDIPGTIPAQPVQNAATPMSVAALTGTASITFHAWECPAGFDVASVSSNPLNVCTTPAAAMSFDLDDNFLDQGGWYAETDQTGTSTVADLPAGTFTVDASIQNGVTAFFLWDCYDVNGASSRTQPLTTSEVFQIELEDGGQLRCDWFNVVGGTARVVINSHACGVLVPAYTLNREQLGQQCTDDPGTIEYTVVSYTHQETQPASQNPLVQASFTNVPSGYLYVGADLPTGWAAPIIWCQLFQESGDPITREAERMALVGGGLGYLVDAGQVLSCDWYNVIQGFANVRITTYLCPTAVDAFTVDLTELVLACTDDPGTADYTVESTTSAYLKTMPVSGGQPVTFSSVPSGSLRMSGKLADGQGVPVVWCGIDYEDATNVVPARRMSIGINASVTETLSAGQTLWCEWFNTPGGSGMVSVWKEGCPAGVDAETATLNDLRASCHDDIPDIPFSLQSGSFSATATSTDLFRYADFPAVPAGAVTVTEEIPAAYGAPLVWCRVQDASQSVFGEELVPVENGSITWDLATNEWLICEWYNLLNTGSTVSITKFDCPEGAGYDETDDWYQENCTQAMPDIPFTLTHSEGQRMGTTDGNGQLQWTDVPLGPFSLQEQIPGGYGDPVVICGFTAFSNGAVIDGFPQRVESVGGYVGLTLELPQTSYFCFWYDIPAGPGDITIHKWACPPGYDPYAWEANPELECTEGVNGVTFEAAGPNGYQSQSVTGDAIEFGVQFGSLEPGSYTVTEVLPAGTAWSFVWNCYGQRMGELRPTPLTVGNTLSIDVAAGESIVCQWFNVPEDPYGTVTVIKFTCATTTFVAEVDCEIYEGGQTFDLAQWTGSAWQVIATNTTDGFGRYSWSGLEPGEYWVAEVGQDWCRMTSPNLSDDGNWLNVYENSETVVKVYNCTGTPGKPGKTPTKYPNTGVPASSREDWRLAA